MNHPLLGHVRFLSEDTITLDIDPLMAPSDLDQMYDDIEFLIQQINIAIEQYSWLGDSLVRRL